MSRTREPQSLSCLGVLLLWWMTACGSGTIIGNGNKPDKKDPVEAETPTAENDKSEGPQPGDTETADPYDQAPPAGPASTPDLSQATIMNYLLTPCGSPFSDRVEGTFGSRADEYFTATTDSQGLVSVTTVAQDAWTITAAPTDTDPFAISRTSHSGSGVTSTDDWVCRDEIITIGEENREIKSVTIQNPADLTGFRLIWEVTNGSDQKTVVKITVQVGDQTVELTPAP